MSPDLALIFIIFETANVLSSPREFGVFHMTLAH